jgi:hypothetical protein
MKELEDFDWFPSILRKYQMEFIGFMVYQLGFYKSVAQMISNDIKKYKVMRIHDLCSGSGLPAIYIKKEIQDINVETILSDKYPQQIAVTDGVTYLDQSLDFFNMEMDSDTYYTMYNAYHHFEPDDQQKIVQKALDNHTNLLIVEIIQPTLLNFVSVTVASTIGVWFFCPWIRPFDWRRIVFTYIIPVNVLTVLIDGIITILKSKTVRQYRQFFESKFPGNTRINVNKHWKFPAQIVTIKISPHYV